MSPILAEQLENLAVLVLKPKLAQRDLSAWVHVSMGDDDRKGCRHDVTSSEASICCPKWPHHCAHNGEKQHVRDTDTITKPELPTLGPTCMSSGEGSFQHGTLVVQQIQVYTSKQSRNKCPAFFNGPREKNKTNTTIFSRNLTAACLKQFTTVKEVDKYVM